MPSPSVHIQPAQSNDAENICDIYNHYILHTPITLRCDPLSADYFQTLIRETGKLPILCAVRDGKTVGFCYATPYQLCRSGYRFAVEISVYVAPDCTGDGIGNQLMAALMAALDGGEVYQVVSFISLPNPASVALHERHGFARCGTLASIGWKHDRWIDVGIWQRPMRR